MKNLNLKKCLLSFFAECIFDKDTIQSISEQLSGFEPKLD